VLRCPVRPIRTVHLDDLALKVAKSLGGLTHFVISLMIVWDNPSDFRDKRLITELENIHT